MKQTLLIVLVVALATIVSSQLIIDEDSAQGKALIHMMMEAINKHEKTTYVFKKLVYTLGDYPNYSVDLSVESAAGTLMTCIVQLIEHQHDKFTTGTVNCHKPN